MKKIVVLGAGYAGLMTAKKLSEQLNRDEAEIILVNKQDYHYETTWLHEVAAGTIKPERAIYPLRDVIDTDHIQLIVEEVVDIKRQEKVVILKEQQLSYDYLVVALGFVTNTFGIKGAEEHTFFIQDVDSSKKIAEHIEARFKYYAESEEKDESDLSILVGGGGFTGIEFVGELSLHLPKLAKKYNIDPSLIQIINIEASPSILGNFKDNPKLVDYSRNVLTKRGVEIRENTPIKEFTKEGFIIGEENELIKGNTRVWTGGVTGNPLVSSLGIEITRGKIQVNPYLQAPGEKNIFVIGDCAWVMSDAGIPYPPTAQAAVQHGANCAKNIVALIRNKPLVAFEYKNKGTVASLGETAGAGAVFGSIEVTGKTGAFMKKVVDDRSLLILGGLSVWKRKQSLKGKKTTDNSVVF